MSWPSRSSPSLPTRVTSAPRRRAQTATLAADPPGSSWTRPDVSEPPDERLRGLDEDVPGDVTDDEQLGLAHEERIPPLSRLADPGGSEVRLKPDTTTGNVAFAFRRTFGASAAPHRQNR